MIKFNININSKSNARIRFLQSLEQADLIYHLYELFKEFSYTEPKTNSSLIKETGNIRHNISFSTRCLPCFNEMYSLFYENKVKVVPNNIDELLSSVELAYWIMGDGSWLGSGLRLHTNNFNRKEVELLNSVINTKFNLNSSINTASKIKSQYTIYISSQNIDTLRDLVSPYVLPYFLYKLGQN
jgi:LAGLIDADG DNA endonuclease family